MLKLPCLLPAGRTVNDVVFQAGGHAAAGRGQHSFGHIDPFELYRSFFGTGEPFNAFDHLGVVVMYSKMVKSIERVSGTKKISK